MYMRACGRACMPKGVCRQSVARGAVGSRPPRVPDSTVGVCSGVCIPMLARQWWGRAATKHRRGARGPCVACAFGPRTCIPLAKRAQLSPQRTHTCLLRYQKTPANPSPPPPSPHALISSLAASPSPSTDLSVRDRNLQGGGVIRRTEAQVGVGDRRGDRMARAGGGEGHGRQSVASALPAGAACARLILSSASLALEISSRRKMSCGRRGVGERFALCMCVCVCACVCVCVFWGSEGTSGKEEACPQLAAHDRSNTTQQNPRPQADQCRALLE